MEFQNKKTNNNQNGLSEKELIAAYAFFSQKIMEFILANFGANVLNTISNKNFQGTIFQNLAIKEDAQTVVLEFKKEPAQDFKKVEDSFKKLFSALYETLKDFLGEEVAKDIFNKIYVQLETAYGNKFFKSILEIVPSGIFKIEKVVNFNR